LAELLLMPSKLIRR